MNCVCGHLDEDHRLVIRKKDGKILGRGFCSKCKEGCYLYLESLDWPNSNGYWWNSQIPNGLFECSVLDGICKLWIINKFMTQSEYEETYGRAKWTKLLETNPFFHKGTNARKLV